MKQRGMRCLKFGITFPSIEFMFISCLNTALKAINIALRESTTLYIKIFNYPCKFFIK